MKKRLLFNSLIIICLVVLTVPASPRLSNPHSLEIIQLTQSHETITNIPEANATLLAKKRGSNYEELVLKTKDDYQFFPYWRNVDTPTYAPRMLFDDINHDGKKEITIILTTGYGSEVLQQQVHVLHEITYTAGKISGISYDEVLVDNPLAIVLKNVTTKLSTHHAKLKIGKDTIVVNIDPLHIQPSNLFSDISFGNLVKFDFVEHELIATVGAQISPAAFIGDIKITYEYKGKMYQSKSIEFIPRRLPKK